LPPRPRPTDRVGLYDPTYEHDACGVAFVARLSGEPSHETVRRAVTALENLEHRGAAGADPNTGDGAGMLLQMPDELMRGLIGQDLPPPGAYGVAVCFLPQDEERRRELEAVFAATVEAEGQRVVCWRDVPVEKDYVGITANWFAPYIKQLVVAASPELAGDQDAFERKLYVIRRVAEKAAGPDLVVPSFSSRTIVYKGMLTAPQLMGYYPDLQDARTKTALWGESLRHVQRLATSWQALSDLCFSDLLLLAPVVGEDGSRSVVLAQVRPTTGQTVYPMDLVGAVVDEVARPLVSRAFRTGEVSLLVVSKVANFSIDLPEAAVAIQVSGTFGSRQEEAQRLGRVLRPKADGRTARFYAVTARDTVDQDFAAHRQRFLAEQGYAYRIVDSDDLPTLDAT